MNGSEATDFHGRLLGLRFEVMYKSVFFCDGAGADGCEGMNIISVLHPSCHVPRLTLLR